MAPTRPNETGSLSGRGSQRSKSPSRRSARIRSQSPPPAPGAARLPRSTSTSGRADPTGSKKVAKLPRVALLDAQDAYDLKAFAAPQSVSTATPAQQQDPASGKEPIPVLSPGAGPSAVPSKNQKPQPDIVPTVIQPSTPRSRTNSNSVSTSTKRLIKNLVRDHFDKVVAPKLTKIQDHCGALRGELLTSTVEARQSLQDEMDTRLNSQADVALSIAQREAKTRVGSLMEDGRSKLEVSLLGVLRAEVPPMVRMSLASAPVSRDEGQTREDIRALTQSLAEEQARVKVLEGRMELCLAGRDAQPQHGRRSQPPRGTRHRYDRRHRARRRSPGHPDSELSEGEHPGRHGCLRPRSRSRSRSSDSHDHLSDRSDEERDSLRHRNSSGSRRNWQGPKEHGLKEINPGDPRFRKVLSYRTYRLSNTDGNRGPSVAYNTGANTRRVAHVMESHIFDGSDPISILSFLARFKQQMDHNKLSEGAACLICPNFLTGDAKEAYENNFELPSDEGGFNSWPEAVQFLLKSYAKDRHIEEAPATLDDIKQKPDEKEGNYAKRLRKQSRRCGGVFDEAELITRFIRRHHEDLKPLLRLIRADYTLPNAFQDYVERAAAQGDAHRALVSRDPKFGRKPMVATKPGKPPAQSGRPVRHVFNVDTHEEHVDDLPYVPQSAADAKAAQVMLTNHHDQRDRHHGGPSYTQSEELDHSQLNSAERSVSFDDEAFLVHPNRNPRLPGYAQPTPHQRPGWLAYRNEPTDICFECFALGHKKPNCPHLAKTFFDQNYRELVKRNYYALTRQQKDYLHAVGRTPTFALTNPNVPQPAVPPSRPSTLNSSNGSVPEALTPPIRGPPHGRPKSPILALRPPKSNQKN